MNFYFNGIAYLLAMNPVLDHFLVLFTKLISGFAAMNLWLGKMLSKNT